MEDLKLSRMCKRLDLFLLFFVSTVQSQTELVKDFQCSVRSSRLTQCSWLPFSLAPDLRFFYRVTNEDGSESIYDNSPPVPLQECSAYAYTGDVRTGCDLQHLSLTQAIHVLLNGTLNNTLVNQTFEKPLSRNVKLDSLNWTVIKDKEQFIISWIPPDILPPSAWEFIINYTECGIEKTHPENGVTSTKLNRVSHCQYNMTLKAKSGRSRETPWSEAKYFDADPDPDPDVLVYAAIILPLAIAVLAALACVCFRKHKEKILPQVPQPRDLLSDISDSNNKITAGSLYTPAKEEDCKISLVIEPNSAS